MRCVLYVSSLECVCARRYICGLLAAGIMSRGLFLRSGGGRGRGGACCCCGWRVQRSDSEIRERGGGGWAPRWYFRLTFLHLTVDSSSGCGKRHSIYLSCDTYIPLVFVLCFSCFFVFSSCWFYSSPALHTAVLPGSLLFMFVFFSTYQERLKRLPAVVCTYDTRIICTNIRLNECSMLPQNRGIHAVRSSHVLS